MDRLFRGELRVTTSVSDTKAFITSHSRRLT